MLEGWCVQNPTMRISEGHESSSCYMMSLQVLMGDNSIGATEQQRQLSSIQARMHSLCPMPVDAEASDPAQAAGSSGPPRRRIRSTSLMSGSGAPAGAKLCRYETTCASIWTAIACRREQTMPSDCR